MDTFPFMMDGLDYYAFSHGPGFAFNGDIYGIVAHLETSSPHSAFYEDIYFQKVSADGLDVGPSTRLGVPAGHPSDKQDLSPSIVWTGSVFVTGWATWREDIPLYTHHHAIELAVIDQDGWWVLHEEEIARGDSPPTLAWTGSLIGASYVVHDETLGTTDAFVSILDPDAAPLYPPLQLSASVNESVNPSITWMGSAFGVIWHEQGGDGIWSTYYDKIEFCE